jgi:hypothetical protein
MRAPKAGESRQVGIDVIGRPRGRRANVFTAANNVEAARHMLATAAGGYLMVQEEYSRLSTNVHSLCVTTRQCRLQIRASPSAWGLSPA